MLFSSPVFLFLFLPIALIGYYLAFRKLKNYWLLFSSLVFFAWGGVSYTSILIISVIFNYFFGRMIERNVETKKAYWWLTFGVSVNILTLGIFKYANFITKNFAVLFDTLALPEIPQTSIILPIGISFYTFHLLSYLIDIYRGKTNSQKNIFDLALYVCMFSQLIAGPIIRYSDVWLQLKERKHSLEKISSGVERFIIGLGKKVILANTFARVADLIFTNNTGDLNAPNAWLGIICYTFQIYCDFAGYSDMAIGLGRMFGFEFQENFNFPYLATSVKDFWHKWHISLSSFFRDYVYIPLGGNRVKTGRMYLNLIFVFFLTGFWHGASWSFVVWGLFHGFFMILERFGFEKILQRTWRPLANLYTFFVVLFAWVLFRADTLTYALNYWKAMFNFNIKPEQTAQFMNYMNLELDVVFVITILGSFGFFKLMYKPIEGIFKNSKPIPTAFAYAYQSASLMFYAGVLILCTMYLIAGTYNPFIYYKF